MDIYIYQVFFYFFYSIRRYGIIGKIRMKQNKPEHILVERSRVVIREIRYHTGVVLLRLAASFRMRECRQVYCFRFPAGDGQNRRTVFVRVHGI